MFLHCDYLRSVMVLTNEESVWSLVNIEKRHGFWIEAQPQSHRQNEGSHQLQRQESMITTTRNNLCRQIVHSHAVLRLTPALIVTEP